MAKAKKPESAKKPKARKKAPNAKAMSVETLKITDLKPDKKNARKHTSRNLQAIKDSLSRFGQQKPIIIDAKNVVKAGNGTLEGAIALGWKTISCLRSNLKGKELTAFAIADNRTAELAEWDMEILAEQLSGLEDSDEDLFKSSGFNEGDLSLMLNDDDGASNNPDEEWRNMPEFKQEKMSYRSLIVHFRSQADFDEFIGLLKQEATDKTKFIWHPKAVNADNSTHEIVSEEV